MYKIEELNDRLDFLKKISPSGGRNLVEKLREAVKGYLARDSDFELQVNKTLDKVIAETFHNGLEYEKAELIDRWKHTGVGNAPLGYESVGDLFKGNDVFSEIMTISESRFRGAFYTETLTSGDVTSVQYHNDTIENWVETLEKAVASELSGLKAIMQYCANRSYGVEWAILFEELNKNVKRHPVRYYAKEIFVTKGYGWLIETFNLNVYRPSYMKELEG